MGAIDLKIFQFLYNLAKTLHIPQLVIVFMAEDLAYVLVAIVLIYLVYSAMSRHAKLRAMISLIVAGTISSLTVTELIRYVWHRPRPFVTLKLSTLITETSYSFPSAHAAIFFALSTVVYFYNKKAGVLFFLTTFLICFGRILAGVHYPSDILAGLVVGVLSGLIARYIENIILKKFLSR